MALTIWHMAFCSTLAFMLVKLGVVQPIDMTPELYFRWVPPTPAAEHGARETCQGVSDQVCGPVAHASPLSLTADSTSQQQNNG